MTLPLYSSGVSQIGPSAVWMPRGGPAARSALPSGQTVAGAGFQARADAQQGRLLLAASGVVGAYYLVFYGFDIYPLRATLVGLLIPALLLLVRSRLLASGHHAHPAWLVAMTAGMSSLAVATASLSEGSACLGFHVIWALPLVSAVLAPYQATASLVGAVTSLVGGLALLARDGQSLPKQFQWAALALGAGAFALFRVRLNQRERADFLRQEEEADTRLATSEERFRLLAENTRDVLWTVDLDRRRFTYVGAPVLEQSGYTAEEMMGRDLSQVLTPESFARAKAMLDAVGTAQEEDPHVAVYEQTCRDGTLRHVEIRATLGRDERGRPVEVVGITRDVTARVTAEQKLRRSEERFRALIEKSKDLILVLDAALSIQFWSAGATEALGWTASEVMGKGLWDLGLVHTDDVAAVRRAWQGLAHSHDASMSVRLRHRDGSWRLIEGLGRNLLLDPAIGGLVVNARDMTAQRHLEDQLHQSQKLESIGRLAGGVAHDFNNMLTVILSCAESIRGAREGGELPELEDVSELTTAGERARDLTRQLLAFARKQPTAPVAVDLNLAVLNSEKLLRRVLGENVEFVFDLHPQLGTVVCDRGQVDQVLLNLAVNGRDAMPEGGQLVVSTFNRTVSARDALDDPRLKAGEWVVLSVKDHGVGMTPEVKQHLFEPFFTTKGPGHGTGLGLATVYGIVTQNDGVITVDSEPGQGATIQVSLPRRGLPQAEAPEAAAGGPLAQSRGGERLLVVEDDALVCRLTVRVLRAAGYRVAVAENGEEALKEVRRTSEMPDLVVTDLVMPRMGGRELAVHLRQQHSGLRVLFVSGYSEHGFGPGELDDGHTASLQKPFAAAVLLARVRAILDAP